MPIYSLTQLQTFLFTNIPLTRHLGLTLEKFDDTGLWLTAPLAPNINDKGTAFAGSLSAAVTISGWSMVQLLLQKPIPDTHQDGDGQQTAQLSVANIVIQKSSIDYLAPIASDFMIHCQPPNTNVWMEFKTVFDRKNKGRLALDINVIAQRKIGVRFRGVYVVQR